MSMTTTIIVSTLTYLLLRSFEAFGKIVFGWYRDAQQDQIERLVDLIEDYKRMLDESAEDKKKETEKK